MPYSSLYHATLMSLLDCYIGLCISHGAVTISFKLLLVFVDEPCLILGVLQLDTTSYMVCAYVSTPATVPGPY